MNKIKFTKMHSAGNHYIYLHSEPLKNISSKDLSNLAIKMSHPQYGVGSDGLVLISKEKKMRMFNRDGSESAMCGNALCSVAKLLYERGIEKKTEFFIELGNKSYPVKLLLDKAKKILSVTVCIGSPDLEMKGFINPKLFKTQQIKKQQAWVEHKFSFTIKGKTLSFKGTLVSFNNPHLVIFCEDIDKIPLQEWGAEIEKEALFPKGINIEFVQKINAKKVRQRTYERGTGETWACGSGACAVCVAGFLSKRTEKKIQIQLLGGKLELDWNQEKNNISLTGQPVEVFSGEFII